MLDLSLPGACADVCHSQVGAIGGDLGVDGVAEDLAPQRMHQIYAGIWISNSGSLLSQGGTTYRLLSRKSRVNT